MSRILFITSNRIGDAVLSTAVLEHARALLPGAGIVIACGPLPAPLFRATPGLERLEIVRKQEGRWRGLWRTLRRDRFDLAIDLRGTLVTLGVSARRRIIHRKSRVLRHKLDEFATMLKLDHAPAPRLHLDERARADATALLGEARPILALGPGSNFIGKQWPPEMFAELARRLTKDGLPGAHVLLLGGPEDAALCASIATTLSDAGVQVINGAGKLDLLAGAAALSRAALFIGNDSGLMHMAAACVTPTIGLFGPSDERVYGPRGPRTLALRGPRSVEDILATGYMPHITHTLMDDLPVDKVEAAARRLVAESA